MSRFGVFFIGLFFVMSSSSSEGPAQWVVGSYEVDGLRVVMKVIEELPAEDLRDKHRWLTVITWEYDVSENGGMPVEEMLSQMMRLEGAIDEMEARGTCFQVYSRTGNGIKELTYYTGSRDGFLEDLNSTLADHPRYPIKIEFFEDPGWEDLQNVHKHYLRKE